MNSPQRHFVIRPDGKPIHVRRQRGQIFYCQQGCCCGKTERGYAPVPRLLYSEEWKRRKMRNRIHLNRAGCLGPCALANVVMLVFDGRPVWFHSMNSDRLILALFDYADSMLEADGFLPPPPELASHAFNGFSWDGTEERCGALLVEQAPAEAGLALQERKILLLSHADSDLLALNQAIQRLPEGFPAVRGLLLQKLSNAELVEDFLRRKLQDVQVVVLRSLGGRQGFVHGFDRFVEAARQKHLDLICLPGTEGLDPELAAAGTVAVPVLHDAYRYLYFGGPANWEQMLRFLADHLLAGGWGYELPAEQPRHGIYRPPGYASASGEALMSQQEWIEQSRPDQLTIGILFYRSHWMSADTEFVDRLAEGAHVRGANFLAVFTTSLKETGPGCSQPAAFDFLRDPQGRPLPDVLLTCLSFAMGGISVDSPTEAGWNVEALQELDLPVLQILSSSISRDEWSISPRGLPPLDVAMNVVLPEFDGRVTGPLVSFKETEDDRAARGMHLRRYRALPEPAQAAIDLALRLGSLRRKPNSQKRIAVVLTNSPGKADRIGNAVGLDSGASLMRLFSRMQSEGYRIENLPADGDSLIHRLIERCSYDEDLLTEKQLAEAAGSVPASLLADWLEDLSPRQRSAMDRQWGPPPGQAFVHMDGHGRPLHLALAGLDLGNVFLALQPPRGYSMDPDAIYHKPDLAPPHYYYGLYRWLRSSCRKGGWGADAIIHLGKHGTLEWLPGKAVGQGPDCFPESILGDLPLFYPFIINDPGEGAQAKRRGHAVVIDHLIPPLTSADVYGELAELTQLVDEYYRLEQIDPSKLPLLQEQIWEVIQKARLDRDLEEMMRYVDHGDHKHKWDGSYTEDGTPRSLAQMKATELTHLLEGIDGYLCELGSLQIRDGLHVLGQVPDGSQLCSLLRALTRVPNGTVPSLRRAVSEILGFDLDALLDSPGRRFVPSERSPQAAAHSDVLQRIDELSLELLADLCQSDFDPQRIPAVIDRVLGPGSCVENWGELRQVLEFICTDLSCRIRRSSQEIDNLIHALQGGYVPAGPSGAPTRGMAQILPTGRNFYAVDPRAVPNRAAWRVGQQLAHQLIEKYLCEEGTVPESVGISIWGTSAMRTHGDDIGQCLALLGLRPVWQRESLRLQGFECISLEELGRPRIDVVLRISGFFRDAFPHLLELLDRAIRQVAGLDEPPQQNFVRKHFLERFEKLRAEGREADEVQRLAGFRIFGSKPGCYGAGILPLIQEQNWQGDSDLALAYVNWGGYAYGEGVYGEDARPEFQSALAKVRVAVKNQDNREHDIFDSDDYLQYHGGMIASIRSLTGKQPRCYFGDNSDPERASVRSLQEEAYRVFRSRVINPKWIESMRRHGYKGALELAATTDYLFGYDATADVMDDWMYERTARAYALDSEMQEFFRRSNPWALHSISERLLEAAQRGMWRSPEGETLQALEEIYLQVEAGLEGDDEALGVSS